MADAQIKWYGDRVLLKIENASEDALLAGAREFVRRARERAPEGATGNLKNSGYAANNKTSDYKTKAKIHKRAIKPKAGSAVAAFAAFYAGFVERGGKGRGGTGHRAARPFMRNTLDQDGGKIGQTIVDAMRKDLK